LVTEHTIGFQQHGIAVAQVNGETAQQASLSRCQPRCPTLIAGHHHDGTSKRIVLCRSTRQTSHRSPISATTLTAKRVNVVSTPSLVAPCDSICSRRSTQVGKPVTHRRSIATTPRDVRRFRHQQQQRTTTSYLSSKSRLLMSICSGLQRKLWWLLPVRTLAQQRAPGLTTFVSWWRKIVRTFGQNQLAPLSGGGAVALDDASQNVSNSI